MKERREKRKPGCVAVDMPSRLRSTWFIPPEIHPNRVWSRPRCAGSTRSHAAPRKGMSPTSSPSARYFGQFLREQNDSHRGGRGDVRGWRHQHDRWQRDDHRFRHQLQPGQLTGTALGGGIDCEYSVLSLTNCTVNGLLESDLVISYYGGRVDVEAS